LTLSREHASKLQKYTEDNCIEYHQRELDSRRIDKASGIQYYPSEPIDIVDFSISSKIKGVYFIWHSSGKCAYIGQGNIMSRIAQHRHFFCPDRRKIDKTKDYTLPTKLFEHDSNASNWTVQYVALPSKSMAQEYEKQAQDHIPSLFNAFHMAGKG
jgi:hypothetical protein